MLPTAQTVSELMDTLDRIKRNRNEKMDAEAKIWKDEMHQKQGEDFEAWYIRFMAVASHLRNPYPAPGHPDPYDELVVNHAYRLVNPGLAKQLAASGVNEKSIHEFMQRAQDIDRRNRQSNLGRGATSTTAPARRTARGTTPASTRTTGPRAPQPVRVGTGAPSTNAKKTYNRSREEIRKLAADNRCFNCGNKGHRANDTTAPCQGKTPTPSKDIDALHAIITAAFDENLDDPDMLYACFGHIKPEELSESAHAIDAEENTTWMAHDSDTEDEHIQQGFH